MQGQRHVGLGGCRQWRHASRYGVGGWWQAYGHCLCVVSSKVWSTVLLPVLRQGRAELGDGRGGGPISGSGVGPCGGVGEV